MATTIDLYHCVPDILANAEIDLNAETFKLALVDDTYVFDAAGEVWADASAAEIAGTGYTPGGKALTGVLLGQTAGSMMLDADDVRWTTLTATFRAAILYAVGTFGARTNPMLAYVLYDDTPADVSVSGVDFSHIWPASGVITIDV